MMYGLVYQYTNTANRKTYIGQTTSSLKKRHREHKCASKTGGEYFYKAIRKYGWEKFDGPIKIDTAANQKELDEKEIYWIRETKSFLYNGYNLTEGGSGGKKSEYTKHKMSVIQQRRWAETKDHPFHSVESRRKAVESLRGRKQTQNEKEAHRIAALTADKTYITPEYRKKMANYTKGTCRRAIVKYKIIFPDQTEKVICNLAKYCRENHHARDKMTRVASGKSLHHHGLKVIRLGV